MKATIRRYATALTLLVVLADFAIAGALDAKASTEAPDARLRIASQVDAAHPAQARTLDVTTRAERTNGFIVLCGAHKDVAPPVSDATYRALIRVLQMRPELARTACRHWHAYREI